MKDFYPYIAESILKKRLYFAEIHIRITKEKQALLLTIPKLTLHQIFLVIPINLSKKNVPISHNHKESTQLALITKQPSLSIESMLSKNFCNEKALKESMPGCQEQFVYQDTNIYLSSKNFYRYNNSRHLFPNLFSNHFRPCSTPKYIKRFLFG